MVLRVPALDETCKPKQSVAHTGENEEIKEASPGRVCCKPCRMGSCTALAPCHSLLAAKQNKID